MQFRHHHWHRLMSTQVITQKLSHFIKSDKTQTSHAPINRPDIVSETVEANNQNYTTALISGFIAPRGHLQLPITFVPTCPS